jgi:hypothetical protein
MPGIGLGPPDFSVMHGNTISGIALVDGTGSFAIPFRFQPRNAEASFVDGSAPPMCGPVTDTTSAEAMNMGSRGRPRWFLVVFWSVSDPRYIEWSATANV